jgi:tetratricopeptide (TPR) repeat protein
MWDEVVKQNIVASGPDTTTWRPGHYTSWLLYGLLQQGRFADGKRFLELMVRNTGASAPLSRRVTLLLMQNHYVTNTEQWDFSLPAVNIAGAGPAMRGVEAYSLGLTALKQNQVARARGYADTLRTLADVQDAPAQVGVLAYELVGLIHVSIGDTARGLGLLRQAGAIEDTLPVEFGPPMVLKPTHEVLGEIYLQLGRPVEAQREFERALAMAPKRLRSLLGLAKAAAAAGNQRVAEMAIAELRRMLGRADPAMRSELGLLRNAPVSQ